MKKLVAAGLAVAALISTGVAFAPMSSGADREVPQISGSQSPVEEAARNAEIARLANAGLHRADASMNKFVVALAVAR